MSAIRNRDAFSSCHPTVNFLFFGSVLLFTMFSMHPIGLVISLAAAIGYNVYLNGRQAVRLQLCYLLPMALLAMIVNPAFNHQGTTILCYLPTGNPLTLESIAFGAASALLLAAVITWFSCYNAVMTSDKFVYLFGRIIPALSLVLSMTLRFVPKFKAQFRVVRDAQQTMGRDTSSGSVVRRIRHAVTIFSIMLTWSLENAIETADSMKSRGYGLPGRSAFSIYRFDDRDRAALVWIGACDFFVLCGFLTGGLEWHWWPAMGGAPVTMLTVLFHLVFLALCLTPVIINGKEDRAWKRIKSGI